jgi:hypothetical protein
VAVLLAGPCPTTLLWLQDLEDQQWKLPPEFDELVILMVGTLDRRWNDTLMARPTTYLVGWPLEGYLEVVRWYPILYEVGADGTFNGFRSYREFKGDPREYTLGTTPEASNDSDPAGH